MERHSPLVSAETLFENIDDEDWVVFDCRHDLMDPQAGPTSYADGHIPGAFHAHVDHDLSDPVEDGMRGRHPLPDPERFKDWLGAHAIEPDTQVVAYDDSNGMWAARLWWLLRHYGHEHVAVLDGGLAEWKRQGLRVDTEATSRPGGRFEGAPGAMPIVDTQTVEAAVADGRDLVDVRAPERFTGETEPVDPVAGHIPGARNIPFTKHTGDDGLFLSPDELKARYEDLVDPIVYCGSGVTAAHAVLATAVAELEPPALYPGSWSAWCHPSAKRPVETGASGA